MDFLQEIMLEMVRVKLMVLTEMLGKSKDFEGLDVMGIDFVGMK